VNAHNDPEGDALGDTIAQVEPSPHEQLEQKLVADEAGDQADDALARLNPREQSVLRMRYGLTDGEPRTLAQIGRTLSLGRERVRQIERGAIEKLQDAA
jgi:RNA polymerase sigma factor (sigma-70 family)